MVILTGCSVKLYHLCCMLKHKLFCDIILTEIEPWVQVKASASRVHCMSYLMPD